MAIDLLVHRILIYLRDHKPEHP